MRFWIASAGLILISIAVRAQSFELVEKQENFQASFSQSVRIPLKIKNNSDKAQVYVVRKIKGELGEGQKGYFCIDTNCQEPGVEEFSKKIEPGETLQNLNFTLESGIETTQTNLRFEVFAKGVPGETVEHAVVVYIDEKPSRSVFQSKEITIHDVYPNPVMDQAYIDYRLHNETLKAKLVLHNVLGKSMGDFELPSSETLVKIPADELAPGVYFYTIYLNNSGILPENWW
jgi:hypothetical protein